MKCMVCGKELHNGLDTFGDVGRELCEACYVATLPLPRFPVFGGKAPASYEVRTRLTPDGRRVLWSDSLFAWFVPDAADPKIGMYYRRYEELPEVGAARVST